MTYVLKIKRWEDSYGDAGCDYERRIRWKHEHWSMYNSQVFYKLISSWVWTYEHKCLFLSGLQIFKKIHQRQVPFRFIEGKW